VNHSQLPARGRTLGTGYRPVFDTASETAVSSSLEQAARCWQSDAQVPAKYGRQMWVVENLARPFLCSEADPYLPAARFLAIQLSIRFRQPVLVSIVSMAELSDQ
jgi:hypothetical protein